MRFFNLPKKFTPVALVMAIWLLLGATPAAAEASSCARTLSSAALAKGFTVTCKGVSKIGIPPNLNTEAARVTISTTEDFSTVAALPPGLEPASGLVSITTISPAEDAHTVALVGPFTVVLNAAAGDSWTRELYSFDPNAQKWSAVDSQWDASKGVIKAKLAGLPALLAVTKSGKQFGIASWYGSRHADAAASNDFPMGTKLRVRNAENDKSVDVVVRSTGPFVSGRVIDLSAKAFAKIQAKWKGVAKVVVEKL